MIPGFIKVDTERFNSDVWSRIKNKVEAIESMVTNGSEFFGLALDAMCVNKAIKKWLLS